MLTRKQLELLTFIHERVQQDGVPPSFDEMKEALDLRSKSGIHRLITALEERGFIRRLAHRARAIEIVKMPETLTNSKARARRDEAQAASDDDGDTSHPRGAMEVTPGSVSLPMMGRIAAGVPIEAISDVATHVAVPHQMLTGAGTHFALEVRGDSMIEAGINDGDIVVIREGDTAQNGDIVVALVEGYEATLKRFRRKGDTVALEAANAAYETRIFRDDQIRLQGRLVGLMRTY
ncbi:transcriptional repressor LexA [Mesobaculum littorinae]|uniref:LexA repressor n=1 Tax=Mesobaculum littorinae TaxID=2486419 RepID=A0A438AKY6_9RHOB|nr:transcriptional repressor LexA [Mesobaculum littorinae]RVV99275.1 transcriptional repressor LexA [Mesobaculum littorinae]